MISNMGLKQFLRLSQLDFDKAKERLLDLQKQNLEIELHNLMLDLDKIGSYDIEIGYYEIGGYVYDYKLNGNKDGALMDITPFNIVNALINYHNDLENTAMACIKFRNDDYDVIFWIEYNGYELFYDYEN